MPRQRKTAAPPVVVDPLVEAQRDAIFWDREFAARIGHIEAMLDSLRADVQFNIETYADNPAYLADGIIRATGQFAVNAREQVLLPAFHLVEAKARLAALKEAGDAD